MGQVPHLSRHQAGESFGPSTLQPFPRRIPRATFVLQHSPYLARDRASSWSMTDHARNSSGLFQNMSAKPRPDAPCIATWIQMTHPPQASFERTHQRICECGSCPYLKRCRFFLASTLTTQRPHPSQYCKVSLFTSREVTVGSAAGGSQAIATAD